MKRFFMILMICLLPLTLVKGEDFLLKKARQYFKPIPFGPPELKDNPLTLEKIELGKMLFFDPRLSSNQFISCNSCHNLAMGGADYQETAVGHGWQRGARNSPTVLNVFYNVAHNWDGSAKDLQEQAREPIQAEDEMNNPPERAVETFKSIPEYVVMFKKAFPMDKDPVTFDNITKALEAFEATLVTPDCKLDKFLRGDITALNKEEKEGLKLFIEKGCVKCHNGINIGGNAFYPFGVEKKPSDKILKGDTGRAKVTRAKKDEFSFRSPSLRNVELTAPYFHSGSVWSLKEAVKIMKDTQISKEMSEQEAELIVKFLKTLTGKQPKITLPILPPSTDSTPKPLQE